LNPYAELNAIIIEDTPTKAEVLYQLLSGFELANITSYSSGEEGLKAIPVDSEHCLLFLDLMLPGLTGQEVLQGLAQKRFKGFVIINSVCEDRIVRTAMNVAISAGIRVLGALRPDYSAHQLNELLVRSVDMRHRKSHAHNVILDQSQIHSAFDQDRIVPFFQPVIDLETETIVALECLARIEDTNTGEYLSPVSFLGGLIDDSFLDNLALRLLQKSLDTLQNDFFAQSTVQLALNLEPSQLSTPAFATTIDAVCSNAGVPPERIIIELTEREPLNTSEQLESVNILRLKGYNIAIDDFGSGHTSITNLHSIPFNRIKIDRQLIRDIGSDNFCKIAVDAMIAMAHEVDALVVLSGVENVNQVIYSAKHQGIYLQGHYFCEALAPEKLAQWISKSAYRLSSSAESPIAQTSPSARLHSNGSLKPS